MRARPALLTCAPVLIALAGSSARADTTTTAAPSTSADPAASADSAGDERVSKKDDYLRAKTEGARTGDERRRWQKNLERRLGKSPPEVINVYNTWTREYLAVEAGTKPDLAETTVNRFFRCHFTNQPAQMDPKLFPKVVEAANHFKSHRIDIVSGFRAPKYNLILRKKGREVARNSQHTHGSAIDFRLRGVTVDRLHRWAKAQKLGGVGIYPSSGFIHMDTWKIRYWTGN